MSTARLRGGEQVPGQLSEVLRISAILARQLSRLHQQDVLHRAISLDTVSWDADGVVELAPPPSDDVEFGGASPDPDYCPPELQGSPPISLPPSLSKANDLLRRAGNPLNARRVDVFQLGSLLCRLATANSVAAYLRSPRVRALAPRHVRALIDHALGFESSARFVSADEFLCACEQCIRGLAVNGEDENSSNGVASESPSLPVDTLGHYQIVARIGRGGMGDVYKARETALDRWVAIKVLPAEFARHEEFVRRFHVEATAVARIAHPNVVPIYFIGEDRGHHFFAMQFVEGESLAECLKRNVRLNPAAAVAVAKQVLRGLSAAHREGIIHRDVKPGNILLDERDGRVLVTDFGLVKSLSSDGSMTATGVVMGTADYISPEQGRGLPVDCRTDLYAVGVVLYEMLSGQLPFSADSTTAMIFQHVYEQHRPLHEIQPHVPAALSQVVDTLLAKSPDDRYSSAEQVLDALRSIEANLSSSTDVLTSADAGAVPRPLLRATTQIVPAPALLADPVLPPGLERQAPVEWWRRWRRRCLDRIQRHAPGFVEHLQDTQQQVDGAVAEYERRRDELQAIVDEANESAQELQRQAQLQRAAAAAAARRAGAARDADEADELLHEKTVCDAAAEDLAAQLDEQAQQVESMRLRLAEVNATLERLRSQRDLLNARLKIAQAQMRLAASPPPRPIRSRLLIRGAVLVTSLLALMIAAVSINRNLSPGPSGEAPAPTQTSDYSRPVSVGEFGEQIIPVQDDMQCLRFTPGRNTRYFGFGFAAGNADGSVVLYSFLSNGSLRTHKPLFGHGTSVGSIAFSPDGTRFATGSDEGVICLWETWGDAGRRQIRQFTGHQGPIVSLAFSADGQQILSSGRDETLRLWEVQTEKEAKQFKVGNVESLSWSADGNSVLVGGYGPMIESLTRWSLHEERPDVVFRTNRKQTKGAVLARLADVALSLTDKRIYVWDVASGQPVRQFGELLRLADFSVESGRVWSVDQNNVVALWDLKTGEAIQTFSGLPDRITAIALSTDGLSGLTFDSGKTLRVWDLPPPPPPAGQIASFQSRFPVNSVAFSPDGFSVVSGSTSDVEVWSVESQERTRRFGLNAPISSVLFSSDGTDILYSTGQANSQANYAGIRITANDTYTRMKTGNRDRRQFKGHSDAVTGLAHSRDGRRAVTGSADGTVIVWDVEREQQVAVQKVGVGVNSVALSSDGSRVVIGANDRELRVWDWQSGEDPKRLSGHTFLVLAVSMSKTRLRAASGGADRLVCAWDLTTDTLLHRLEGHSGRVNSVAINNEGRLIASASDDGTVRLWDVAQQKEIHRWEGHRGPVRAAAFAPDGTRIVTGGEDGTVRIWALPSDQ